MKLQFYAGKCLPIHAHSLEERPLGGTETALIRLSEILHRRGHEVTIFTSLKNPPKTHPTYLFHQEVLKGNPCDAFIFLKEWWPALFQIPAKKTMYWTGDSFDQYVNFGIGDRRIAGKIDYFLAVSEWQAKTLSEVSGFPYEKSYVIKNGVHLDYFKESLPKNPKRLIHSSSPYRGLALVPKLYEQIVQQVPDVELHIFSGLHIYDTEEKFQGPQVEQYQKIVSELEKLPNVKVHGNVTQKQLAKEYLQAGILFYPNVFAETSCITAMEAMAGGCPVVTSDRGALRETIQEAGFFIAGEPGSETYNQSFIEKTLDLLKKPDVYQNYSQRAKEIAASYSWENVADRFEELLKKV